jgi:hypothetical protein
MVRLVVGGIALVAALGSLAQAQTSYPMITHISPVAIQRGKSVEITVEGKMNFAGAHTMLIEGTGVSGERVAPDPKAKIDPAVQPANVKWKVTAAADAPLGVREFRLATSLGISTLGQLLIADDPVVLESADNDTVARAQTIAVPCVVSGRIEAVEDVDTFHFKGRAGQTIVCEVFCARIEDKIHDLQKHADPLVALYDDEGRELTASDDAVFADPRFSFTLKRDGDYIIQIRDAKYDGDPRWVYALAVTDRPYVTQMYPLALNPNVRSSVEPVGSARIAYRKMDVATPERPGIHAVQLSFNDIRTNPTACVVTPLPLSEEQEPNDTAKNANPLAIPGGVNGRVGRKWDLDHFRFKASKGKAIKFEIYSRRFGTILNSSLDSMIDVLNASGAVIASNDDANGKDSLLVFTPPADGDYVLRVRDLHSRGGDNFGYFLEADFARPDFALKCDPSKAMIGPGGHAAWFVQATRLNGFIGPIDVRVSGLPPSVTVNKLTIPPTMTQGLLVLSASPNATKPIGFMASVIGSAEVESEGKSTTIERTAIAVEEIYNPGGGRGRFDVNTQAVAITEPTDILAVRATPDRLTLKPGQEVKIDVEIERRKDFDKVVNIDVPLRHLGVVHGLSLPPGVTMVDGKSKTLLGQGTKGHITLKVDPSAAAIEDVPISVVANVSINFVVKVGYSSPPILISVRE